MSANIFRHWRNSLEYFIDHFHDYRQKIRFFYPKLFLLFILINLTCYWLALLIAFPGHIMSEKSIEYTLMGFPVAFLGGVFDILSLFVTLYIIHRALESNDNLSYISYLSVDIFIAVLATFWLLFVFMVSGWIVSMVLSIPETLEARHMLYQDRVAEALTNPTSRSSLKNIFFGVIMGGSALLPTMLHIVMAVMAMMRSAWARVG